MTNEHRSSTDDVEVVMCPASGSPGYYCNSDVRFFLLLNNICSRIVAKNFQIMLIATIAAQAWICGHDGDVDDHMMVVNILTYCHLYLYFYADPNPQGGVFACMDWTFGSKKIGKQEEAFRARTSVATKFSTKFYLYPISW